MGILKQDSTQLIFMFNGETLVIEPWGPNSLRVRSRIMQNIIDSDFSLLTPEIIIPEISIAKNEASICNGKITAEIKIDGWHGNAVLSFYNEKGELLIQEQGTGGALNLKSRHFKPIIGGDHSLTVTFDAPENEKLYGMGQYQQEFLDIKHCQFELAHRNSQASIPFVVSSKGYGFLWHNPAIGHAHFNKNTTVWHASSTKQLDYWITAGDTPSEITQSYANVTGKVPMMPEYGLGFWQCKLRYYNQEQLLQVAREYKKRNLPIDVIVCDFFHWPYMGDFRFDEYYFPDPKSMVEELQAMDIELMVSVWPQIDHKSENYQEMKDHNYLVKSESGVDIDMLFGGNSVFFDSTNPSARDYVWNKCKKNYYDYGIKLFWLDEAEPEYGTYDFDNYRYHIGPNVQIGNLYPQHFSKTFYDGLANQNQKEIVNLVRCAWSGSQRYGALVWSGDIHSTFKDMRRQIYAGLHMGLSGIPWWTTDIGGFHGGNPDDPAFRELLIRWFQYGTFCPVMRLHGDRQPTTHLYKDNGDSSLFTGSDNEVWSFGEEAYEILKKYLFFRETLRPYTRTLMEEAHTLGNPVMRTMFYEFPSDPETWTCPFQYMYGPDLLIAPITESQLTKRTIYLPANHTWTDLHTGMEYEGGKYYTVKAPLDVIPVYVKDHLHVEWIGLI